MNRITSMLVCLLLVGEIAGQNVPITQRWWTNFPLPSFRGHAIAYDSKRIITARASGEITILDALTGDTIVTWRGHDNEIRSIDASPINDYFATCSNTEVKVWSLNTRSLVRTIPVIAVLPGGNSDVSISPSGNKVGVGWGGHGYIMFDVATGDSLSLSQRRGGGWKPILMSDDSTILIGDQTGPSTNLARFVNIYTLEVLDEYRNSKPIHNVELNADGRYMLLSTDESVYIIDRDVKNIVWSKSTSQSLDDGATAMITRGGGHVLIGRIAGEGGDISGIQLVHWPTNSELGSWPLSGAAVGRLAPDSSFFAFVFQSTAIAVGISWEPTSVSEEQTTPIEIESTDNGVLLRHVPESFSTLQWTLTDISGRRVTSGNSVRVADVFVIVPQPKPSVGVYILQISAASGVIGSWTISLY